MAPWELVAVRWCAIGAIKAAARISAIDAGDYLADVIQETGNNRLVVRDSHGQLLPDESISSESVITAFNDRLVSKNNVMAMFDLAIDRLEGVIRARVAQALEIEEARDEKRRASDIDQDAPEASEGLVPAHVCHDV